MAGVLCPAASAQNEAQVRIAGRRIASGGIEVALQQSQGGNHWADRILPSTRFLSRDTGAGRWQYSSPVAVQTSAGKQWVRIAARQVDSGGTEVALQQLEGGDHWGSLMLPRLRFMPEDASVDRWLASSPLLVSPPTAPSTPSTGSGEGTPLGLITPTGVTVAVLGITDDGYTVTTPCGNVATVTNGRPLWGIRVVIDPGHGGPYDVGAVGPNGLAERDLNLTLSSAVLKELARRGIAAASTRTGHYGSPLPVRAAFADALGAEALVSIHHNAPTRAIGSQPGTEIFVQSASTQQARADSARLGGLLQDEITSALAGFDNISWSSARDAGVLRVLLPDGRDAYGMIRRPRLPTALVEYGYLSNPSEAALFATDEYIRVAAKATANAIEAYLNTNRTGAELVEQPRVFDPARAPTRCNEVALQ